MKTSCLLAVRRCSRPVAASVGVLLAMAAGASFAQATAVLTVADAAVTGGLRTMAMPFTVTRSGDLGFAVAVSYATQDGTAVAGTHYVATTGTVTIPAGQTSATVSVPLKRRVAPASAIGFSLVLRSAVVQGVGPWKGAGNAVSGRYAEGSAVADFNGDGKPDVALPSFVSNDVTVLRNDTPAKSSSSSFSPAAVLTGVSGPSRLVAADINGDGRPDLVVPNLDNNLLRVYINTTPAGATTFSFAATSVNYGAAGGIQVAAADFDGDGKVDIAVASPTPALVSVLLNRTPTGALAPMLAAPVALKISAASDAYAYALAAGDFNRDGRPDLTVGNIRNGDVVILSNTTPKGAAVATFAAPVPFLTFDGASGLATADFNGDGKLDIVTAEMGIQTVGNSWSILTNTTPAGAATPTFDVFTRGTSAPYAVATGDLNGDGKPDVVFASLGLAGGAQGGLAVYVNTTAAGGPVTMAEYATIQAGDEPHTVSVADFNGDGLPDFVTMDTTSTLSTFLFGQPPGASAVATIADGTATGTIKGRRD